MSRTALIAGNWKMNAPAEALDWGGRLERELGAPPACEVLICPPATLIHALSSRLPGWVRLGGQDCSAQPPGAHTGDIAASMLRALGCTHVLVGHSERRADHHESDDMVKAKAEAAIRAGLKPIVCVGETLAERETGQAEQVVMNQLSGGLPDGADAQAVVIAYEPVWAIGTGKTATPGDAQAMHAQIRKAWRGGDGQALRILYGGSVKPETAGDLMAQPDIDGALVGGASLEASDFAAIVRAVR
ncbi:MAG: triose-phosphate isomerase [Oceanicaulis sp.]